MNESTSTEARKEILKDTAGQSGPRWKLVRVGEGPTRKWVWQLAEPPGAQPAPRELPRQ